MGQRSLRDATIVIKDGTGSPQSVTLKVGEGSFSFSEKRNIEYKRDRGRIDTVREGDEEPVDVSFDFVWDWLRPSQVTGTSDCIKAIIKGEGTYKSTGASCEPYACDIQITLNNVDDCTPSLDEVITLADFRYESISYNLKEGQISCTGKCNIKNATIV